MSTGAVGVLPDGEPETEGDLPEMTGPQRRCLATGIVRPREEMIRFVVGPDDQVVPDLAERLPGRGMWVSANAASIDLACARNLFSRGAKRRVSVSPDLRAQIAVMLRRRLVDMLGMARRSGVAVSGFEKVEGLARAGRLHGLMVAADAGKDGRGKLEALARSAYIVDILDSRTLGGIFGTIGIVVYAGISDKAQAARVRLLVEKLKAIEAGDLLGQEVIGT